MSPQVVLTAITVGAVAVSWWPLLLALGAPGPTPAAPLAAHVFGMLAGYAVVVLVVLMSRTPALERDVGADVLARWHAAGGRTVVGLVVAHAWAATAAWAESRGVSTGRAFWQVLGLPGLAATTIGTALLIGVGVASARAARRRLSYERWHGIHLLTYVAIAMTFFHQLAGPDLAGHRVVQVGWALLYTTAFALLIRYRVIAPLRQAGRHRLRVARVVQDGPGVVSIEIVGRHLDELRIESGQFFRWRFLTPDHWSSAHPFSLSAPPRNHRLRLTVKALGDGSKGLQQVEPGTWVVAEGPYRAMTAARRTRPNVLLIAGGVGITPMRCLFETMPLGYGEDVTLLYRANSWEDLVFRDELEAIARGRDARLVYMVGADPSMLSASALLQIAPDLLERDIYLCGPPGLSAAVRSMLAGAGHDPEYLHEERFSW